MEIFETYRGPWITTTSLNICFKLLSLKISLIALNGTYVVAPIGPIIHYFNIKCIGVFTNSNRAEDVVVHYFWLNAIQWKVQKIKIFSYEYLVVVWEPDKLSSKKYPWLCVMLLCYYRNQCVLVIP